MSALLINMCMRIMDQLWISETKIPTVGIMESGNRIKTVFQNRENKICETEGRQDDMAVWIP